MTTEQLPPQATVDWSRGKWSLSKGKYSREHTWLLDGGVKLRASDAEFLLPEGYRDGVRLDPEKTFVATIASAHMLSWLHLAFGYGIEVESYRDTAVGVLGELSPQVYCFLGHAKNQRSDSPPADYIQRAQRRHGDRRSEAARASARATFHRTSAATTTRSSSFIAGRPICASLR